MAKNKQKQQKGKDTKKEFKDARIKANKLRKVQRHVARFPADAEAAKALTTITAAGAGPVPVFPARVEHPRRHTPDGSQDLQLEYRRHHTVVERKGGKRVSTIVLDEQVCSQPLYVVESVAGVVQEVTPSYPDALRFFTDSHGACVLAMREGARATVLKNKKATPPKGFENQFKKAYAG